MHLVIFSALQMRTCLGVLSHVLEKTSDAAHALIKMMSFLQGV